MCRFLQALAVLLIASASSWSQDGADLLEPKKLSRADSVLIVVKNVPNGAKATKVVFVPVSGARPWAAEGDKLEQTPDAADKSKVTVSTHVPTDAVLGNYHASVTFDNKKVVPVFSALSIQPPGGGNVHLSDVYPSNTYDWEEVWTPDPSNWTPEQVETKRVTLTVDASKKDSILIDGSPAHIVWTGCDNLPESSQQAPLPELRIFGRVAGGTIELCRVPDGSNITIGDSPGTAATLVKNETVWRCKRKGIATRTADLTLHGSGFLSETSDNVIWINKIPTNILWDTCAVKLPKGTSNDPVTLQTHGEVVTPQEIRLCRVPVPEDGEMRIAAGFGDIPSEPRVFRVFSMSKAEVASMATGVALVLAILPLGLLSFGKRAYSIGNQPYKLRMLFLDPETDTYSLSKLQFYLWTVASIFAYVYLFISFVNVQHLPWPDVPSTLPGIIAVAAGTAVGSQLISANKGSKGAGEQQPNLSDFITSGGVVAPDRLQMLLWTLIGVGAFFLAVLDTGPGTISGLPPVPDRLLVLMGISSAGYLGGKMARAAGPVINEISVTPSESDATLAIGAAPATVLPDLVAATTGAQHDLSSFQTVTNSNASITITSLSDAIKAAGAAQTVSELNQLVETLRTLKGKAEQGARDAAGDFQARKATQAEAETAQKAASTLQDFSADVMRAISVAGATSMQFEESPALNIRTIDLRGTNMSSEAVFEIDHADLPFRMFFNKDGQNAPDIVIREDATPRFARVLRLTIDPARLGSSDVTQFQKWFGVNGVHTFTLTNPDGQKAELIFSLPPGEAQKATA